MDVTFQATILSAFARPVEMNGAALICQGHERSVAIAGGGKIEICNAQGVVQKTIQFSEDLEGSPVALDVSGGFLVAATSLNFLRIWCRGAEIGGPWAVFGLGSTVFWS